MQTKYDPALATDLYTGNNFAEVCRILGWDRKKAEHCRKILAANGVPSEKPAFTSDKKNDEDFSWRKASGIVKSMQELSKSASRSQDEATIRFDNADKPIMILPIADWHFGSYASDYDLIEKFTDLIVNTPGLYIAIVGDMGQFAIKMRGVLEMMDNALPPKLQTRFIESWLAEVAPKVLWSTWDNHGSTRFEDATGIDQYGELFSRNVIYFNHIGHVDIAVNDVDPYRIATSHFFKGKSTETNMFNGMMKYLRITCPEREMAIAGDIHKPGHAQYTEGGEIKTVINTGTMQTSSGYAKRYFTLKTFPDFPCFTLHHKRHAITPYWSVYDMLESQGIIIHG
jgi:hypothetical protein